MRLLKGCTKYNESTIDGVKLDRPPAGSIWSAIDNEWPSCRLASLWTGKVPARLSSAGGLAAAANGHPHSRSQTVEDAGGWMEVGSRQLPILWGPRLSTAHAALAMLVAGGAVGRVRRALMLA